MLTRKWKIAAMVLLVATVAVTYAAIQANLTPSAGIIFGQPTLTGNTARTDTTGLSSPAGIFVDPDYRVWVCDAGNNRVLIYSGLTDTTPDGAIGDTYLGDAGLTPQTDSITQLTGPRSVAYIKGTNCQYIAVADSANRILLWHMERDSNIFSVFAPNSNFVESRPVLIFGQKSWVDSLDTIAALTASDSAADAFSIALAKNDLSNDTIYLFASLQDSHAVVRWRLRDTSVHHFTNIVAAGDSVLAPKYNAVWGIGAPATTQIAFNTPRGICIDGGKLYVADSANNRILRFPYATALDTWYNNTAATPTADSVWGQINYTRNDNVRKDFRLTSPVTSDTAITGPTGVIAKGSMLAVTDGPLDDVAAAAHSRRILFWRENNTGIQKVFGMCNYDSKGWQPNGNTTSDSSMTSSGGVAFVVNENRMLASDPLGNRVLLFPDLWSDASTVTPDNNICVINSAVGSTSFAGMMPALRGVRDVMMANSLGRFIVSGYYGFGLLIVMIASGCGVFAFKRR